jgi:hypothetical protein
MNTAVRKQRVRHSLGTQYENSSRVQQWPRRHMQCAQGEQSGGAAEGSYEQEAAAVEDYEEMEQEDEGGMAKRPDLNELDVPE